jgi:hypothetical protein
MALALLSRCCRLLSIWRLLCFHFGVCFAFTLAIGVLTIHFLCCRSHAPCAWMTSIWTLLFCWIAPAVTTRFVPAVSRATPISLAPLGPSASLQGLAIPTALWIHPKWPWLFLQQLVSEPPPTAPSPQSNPTLYSPLGLLLSPMPRSAAPALWILSRPLWASLSAPTPIAATGFGASHAQSLCTRGLLAAP